MLVQHRVMKVILKHKPEDVSQADWDELDEIASSLLVTGFLALLVGETASPTSLTASISE